MNVQNISRNLVEFLRKFPIFLNNSGNFALMAHYIPPPAQEIPAELLCGLPDLMDVPAESFPLARALGAQEISFLQFYKLFVFPRLSELEASVRDCAMIKLLRKLPEIPNEEIRDLLGSLKFIPTSSGISSSLFSFLVPEVDTGIARD
jgi:hypothetical protein